MNGSRTHGRSPIIRYVGRWSHTFGWVSYRTELSCTGDRFGRYGCVGLSGASGAFGVQRVGGIGAITSPSEKGITKLAFQLLGEAVTTRKLNDDGQESILQEAHRLTHGERNGTYAHPYDDYSCTAALFTALLGDQLRSPITAHQMALAMCCVKLSRESRIPKRDNLVDLAGYAWVARMCHEEHVAQTQPEVSPRAVAEVVLTPFDAVCPDPMPPPLVLRVRPISEISADPCQVTPGCWLANGHEGHCD